MDAVLSFFTWPLLTLFAYIRFVIGAAIVLPSYLLKIITFKTKNISKFDNLFSYLSNYPLGLYVFSGIVPFFAPYTSSVSPLVLSLSKENCKAIIYDYPWLRNPFDSIHAIALANLGEFTGGLSMITQLQYNPKLRGIITNIAMEYKKKARGRITAIGSSPNLTEIDFSKLPLTVYVTTQLYNKSNEVVAICVVTWIISIKRKNSKIN